MNILISSVGRRNKIIQLFKHTLNGTGKVVAADMSTIAPALCEADVTYKVPPINAPDYVDVLLDIVRKEQVSAILSLIDPELSLLAKNADKFSEAGCTVIGSDYELCELTLDKWEMYNWLSAHGYNCAKSYIDKDKFFAAVNAGEISYPVFVKPTRGSASIDISKVYDKEIIEYLFAHNDGLMIQEFLNGTEIGADVYIDMISSKTVSVFTKKKLAMRAGETDQSVSFSDPKLFELIVKFTEECGFKGAIDIDIFDVDGKYYISEVNPRFGGGYPHAFACGVNHAQLIINNINGNENPVNIGCYEDGIYMMKYSDIVTGRFDNKG